MNNKHHRESFLRELRNRWRYLAGGLLLLTACNAPKAPDRQGEYADNLKQAEATVKPDAQKPENDRLESKGVIAAEKIIPVSSRISGQIVSFNVTLGQHVTQGQVLVRLDDTESKDRIKRLKAEYEQAHYRYEAVLMGLGYKRSNLDNATAVHQSQAATNSGLDVARASYEEALHQQEYYVIKAPISGVVSDLTAENYTNIQAGQPLFFLIDETRLLVHFDVLESELSSYQVGTPVTVTTTAYPDEQYQASVKEISPEVKENGTVTIHASLPQNKHLIPGMSASILKK